MPSRKSNVSTATNGAEETTSPVAARPSRESTGMSVEDLSLPRTMISRLSKGVLPANTQIQKDALSALSKSATVFVNYIASNAMENASGAGKKTIQPQDVLVALKDSEFEFMIPRIEAELKKYNTVQCDKRNTYRRKVKADKAATTSTNPNAAADADTTLNTAENSTVTSPAADDADAETALSSAATVAAAAAGANGGTRDDDRPAKKMRFDGEEGDDEEDVDDGAEDPAEDDEGEIDEDEEMEEDDDEDDEDVEDEGEDENGAEGDEERIQRQIERDEALDEGGESD